MYSESFLVVIVVILLNLTLRNSVETIENNEIFNYPDVFRDESIKDDFFGVEVIDPYRWLENTDDNRTKKFIDEQNFITKSYVEKCVYRKEIYDKFKNLLQYERIGCPFKRGDYYYIYKNNGLENQSILYRMLNGTNLNNLKVFIDTNRMNTNGTVSIASISFSNDGKWCAYGIDESGSDWNTIRVRSVDNETDLDEQLTNIKFSAASWTHDNQGFFYSRFPNISHIDGTNTALNRFNKLYYHRIGTKQQDDILIYETPDTPTNRFIARVSDCGQYLHVFIKQSSEFEAWYYYHLNDTGAANINGKLPLKPIIETFDSSFDYVSNDGPIHYIHTNRNASNYRLVKVNLTDDQSLHESNWIDLVLEHDDDVLNSVHIVNENFIICHYIHDVHSRLEIRNLTDGTLIKPIKIPLGSINWITGKRKNNTQAFFSFTSFVTPKTIYRIDFSNQSNIEASIYKQATPKNFNPNKFITKQIFYTSKDNQTKIPMFLVYKKDLNLNETHPTLLYGYGGFNSIMKPSFSSSRLIMLENLNGIYALAGIRGGGEYGKQWHHNGKLLQKQNSFDDFIAAAEYLIDNNYTEPKKLIIEGGSNGGLLVASVSNQRPDLFGCTICRVG